MCYSHQIILRSLLQPTFPIVSIHLYVFRFCPFLRLRHKTTNQHYRARLQANIIQQHKRKQATAKPKAIFRIELYNLHNSLKICIDWQIIAISKQTNQNTSRTRKQFALQPISVLRQKYKGAIYHLSSPPFTKVHGQANSANTPYSFIFLVPLSQTSKEFEFQTNFGQSASSTFFEKMLKAVKGNGERFSLVGDMGIDDEISRFRDMNTDVVVGRFLNEIELRDHREGRD